MRANHELAVLCVITQQVSLFRNCCVKPLETVATVHCNHMVPGQHARHCPIRKRLGCAGTRLLSMGSLIYLVKPRVLSLR